MQWTLRRICSLLMAKENQKTTSDFDALDPRIKGCSPLIIPKKRSKQKKLVAVPSALSLRFFRFSGLKSLRDSRRLAAADAASQERPIP